jgi:hypothetical protein
MGRVFAGEWVITDEAGARMSVPYAVRKIVLDRFAGYPPRREYWQPYRWSDTAHIIVPRIDRVWGDTTLQYAFGDSPHAFPLTIGMHSDYTVSGDFSCSLEYQFIAGADSEFDWHFVVAPLPDTSMFFGESIESGLTYAGFHLSYSSIGYGLFGEGEAEVHDEVHDASAGTLRLERIDGRMAFYYKPKYLDKVETLKYPYDPLFEDDDLYIHVRMSVYGPEAPEACELLRFKVDRGVLSPRPRKG